MTVKLDPHDATHSETTSTFPVKYIVDTTYFDVNNPGPILMYAGNEGPISEFYQLSGFITKTMAEKHKAMSVFIEHRFYGESIPSGGLTDDNLKYLTVENTMLDYLKVLDYVKKDLYTDQGHTIPPVIVFGGSYGGMLAFWLRTKYPHVFEGAIASSAPIMWFDGVIDPSSYTNVVANDILNKDMGGQECFDKLKYGFYDMQALQYDPSTYATVQSIFNVCDNNLTTSAQFGELIAGVQDTIAGMSQVNYPYSVRGLPANPLLATCNAIKEYKPSSEQVNADEPSVFDYTHIHALAAGFNVANGASTECLQLTGDLGPYNAWEYQTCTQLPMPQGDDPSKSCFTWDNYDKDGWTKYCEAKYKQTPQYDYALNMYGGRKPSKDFADVRNVVFSQGTLDPWRAGGVNTNITDYTTTYVMEGAAHHLDIFLPNAADPVDVVTVRDYEDAHITKWIKNFDAPPAPPAFIQ